MNSETLPITTDLVLIGGGHSHAIVLKMWGMKPIPGVRLTLISDTSHTPYSGMLPGYVAGFYSYDETHIDLRRLANFAQAQFYLTTAIGLDLENKQVLCEHRPPVAFDFLSIDIGSTPNTISVPGAKEYAIPAKPVPQFLTAWHQIITQVSNNPEIPITLAIVGGGAGGVELALNMQARLHQILKATNQPLDKLKIAIFQRGLQLLSGHNHWVSSQLENILINRGIQLFLHQSVTQVLADKIICDSGFNFDYNYVFWVTQASAPNWLKQSGIAVDSQGFILVNNYLQSLSHPDIFAAGDIATIQNHPRPKAGVFAVRQGKPLFENLQRIILAKKLKSYIPQKLYLALIGTGDKNALASWGYWGWRSPLLWRWKDHIDRQFMRRFSE